MSYLLTIGKKLQRTPTPSFPPMPIAPAPARAAPAPKPEVVAPLPTPEPIAPPPTPEPEPEPESIGASPIPDAELIPVASEEQYASLPVLASTTSSHTESSSE